MFFFRLASHTHNPLLSNLGLGIRPWWSSGVDTSEQSSQWKNHKKNRREGDGGEEQDVETDMEHKTRLNAPFC